MRKLIFPAESYTSTPVKDKEDKFFLKSDKGIIGVIELLWTGVVNSECKTLTKKEHKINKRLITSLESISRFKDDDEDSRVAFNGEQTLIIEEDEYELLKKLLEANTFFARVSGTLTDLWEIIDNAELFTPMKAVSSNETE